MANAGLKQMGRARRCLQAKLLLHFSSSLRHTRSFIMDDGNDIAVRDVKGFHSCVHFILPILTCVALGKQTCLQNAGAKLPIAVNKMGSRCAVALCGLRGPCVSS